MAVTKTLNSTDTVYVTTYYGGEDRGRCYTFTAIRDGRKAVRDFTEKEFMDLIFTMEAKFIGPDDNERPSFDG